MDYLDDLIRFENEHSGLDFKRIQYKKDQFDALIKDVMSMANAEIENARYIIIGVRYKSSNEREILGIKKDEFEDSATYQQIIRENIEPEVNIDYFSYEVDGKCVGILRLSKCEDKPYMMRKDFRGLKKGDSFIRKGSSQSKMTRQDLDKILAKIKSSNEFKGKVKIYFSDYGPDQEITLPVAQDIELPSKRAANKIRKIIEKKKKQVQENPYHGPLSGSIIFLNVPYEERSIEELEKNLESIDETYIDDDYYEFFELRSHKLNLTILNEGDAYIEEASLQIDINKMDGLVIPEKIYPKPSKSSSLFEINHNLVYDFGRYPEIEDNGTYIRIYKEGWGVSWNIKHLIPEKVFVEPIRFLFLRDLAGKIVQLNCKLYGKNLKEPIETTLRIKVVSI